MHVVDSEECHHGWWVRLMPELAITKPYASKNSLVSFKKNSCVSLLLYKIHVFLLVAFFKIAVKALIMKRTTTIVAGVFAERSKRLEADAMISALAKLWHRNDQTRVTNVRLIWNTKSRILFKTNFHDVIFIVILKYSYDFMVKYIHDNTMTLKKIAISCSVIK